MSQIELSMDSLKFDRVKVYQNGAEVTRLLKINLKPGVSNIEIDSVTDKIDIDTIQVFSSSDVDIEDVQIKKTCQVNDKKISKLKLDIDNLEVEYQQLNNKLEVVNLKIKNLNNFLNRLSKNSASLFGHFFECFSNKIDLFIKEKIDLECAIKSVENNLKLSRHDHESQLKKNDLK